MELQMIGTGSAFAKKYYNNNALVTCNGFRLLIDFGITGPLALHHMQTPLEAIDGVLVTHLHADHIGGLEELAFRMKFNHGKKPLLYIEEQLVEPLWNTSLKAGMEFGGDSTQSLDDFFRVVPLQIGKPAAIHAGLRLEILPTAHIRHMPSYAVILNDNVFYSGDTVFDPRLIQAFTERGCGYLLHDCQLEGPGHVHATLQELLTLPADIQRSIWLMHYGDNMESYIGRTGDMRFMKQHERYEFTDR